MSYTVGIVGLGNIGMLYDYDHAIDSGTFLSHFQAFHGHPEFDVIFGLDQDEKKLDLARNKFGQRCKLYRSIDQVEKWPDVLVLASIPQVNKKLIQELKSKSKVKLFIVEKPFWTNEMESEESIFNDPRILINYPRKYLPQFFEARNLVQQESFGKALGIHCWYSKGLRNNGSHIFDLIGYLFNSHKFDNIHVFQVQDDHTIEDKSVGFSAHLQLNNYSVPVVFQCANENNYSLIECDLLFEKKRMRLHNFCFNIDEYEVESDPVFPDYENLVFKETVKADLNSYMYRVVEKIKDILNGLDKSPYQVENERKIFKTISRIREIQLKYEGK